MTMYSSLEKLESMKKRSSELLERLHWPLSKSLEEDPDIPVIKEMLVLLYMNPKIHLSMMAELEKSIPLVYRGTG